MADSKKLEQQVEQYEKDKNNGKKKSKKTIIKYLLNISLVLIVTAVSVVLTLYGNTNTIFNLLIRCDYRWLLVILLIMLTSMMVRSFILFCFARLYTRKYHFHQAMACDQIGVFYNAVTPGASGGQIMQAYTYKKQGLHISSGVSALAMYSIVFQIVLIIYGLLAFIIKFDLINSIGDVVLDLNFIQIKIPAIILTILGFLLNISVILLVLLMGYWHSFHNFVMGPIIGLFAKMHIIKNPDRTRESLRIQVENFKIEFRRLLTNIPFFILVAVSFVIYMTLKFSIPYFCGRALGNQSTAATFWDSVFLGNYHQMVTGLIPIPGSAGVSEYFFDALFYNAKKPWEGFYYSEIIAQGEVAADVFNTESESYRLTVKASSGLCHAALLIWRSITFIVPIVVSGFVTAFYRSSPKDIKQGRDGDLPNRGTFVELQRDTYILRKSEVEDIIHTQQLNRKAIMEKLNVKNKSNRKKKDTDNNQPNERITSGDYDKVEVDDGDDSI